MKLAYPAADIPTVQLSLKATLDPAEHIRIGQALQPLRDQGVYIIGAGMTYHNRRGFFGDRDAANQHAEAFSSWLVDAVQSSDRLEQLQRWEQAPAARACHPREEHLLPLMVAAGAAGQDAAQVSFDGPHMGLRCLSFAFGQ